MLAAHPDRLGAVGRRPDDREVGLRGEQRGEAGAHDLLVVGDHDPHVAVTPAAPVVERQRRLDEEAADRRRPVRSSPPTVAARSRIPSSPCPRLARRRTVARVRCRAPARERRRRRSRSSTSTAAPGRVAAGVGQRLLDDAVRGQLDARVERRDAAADDQPRARRRQRRAPRRAVSLSCCSPGCGRRGWRSAPGVLAQHAQQPAHLGQRRPGGVADRGQPPRALGGHARGGQPGRLRLHGDHRDVVRHDVVQLAGDARPLAAASTCSSSAPLDRATRAARSRGAPRRRGRGAATHQQPTAADGDGEPVTPRTADDRASGPPCARSPMAGDPYSTADERGRGDVTANAMSRPATAGGEDRPQRHRRPAAATSGDQGDGVPARAARRARVGAGGRSDARRRRAVEHPRRVDRRPPASDRPPTAVHVRHSGHRPRCAPSVPVRRESSSPAGERGVTRRGGAKIAPRRDDPAGRALVASRAWTRPSRCAGCASATARPSPWTASRSPSGAGEVTGFVGPNGAGKSTTMRLILGLDAPGRRRGAGRRPALPLLRTPLRQVGALLDAGGAPPGPARPRPPAVDGPQQRPRRPPGRRGARPGRAGVGGPPPRRRLLARHAAAARHRRRAARRPAGAACSTSRSTGSTPRASCGSAGCCGRSPPRAARCWSPAT